jgi:uncharacterized protein
MVARPSMGNDITAEDIMTLLELKRHPTCGFVHEAYRSQQRIKAGDGPPAGRPLGSVLYFLVTPEAHIVMHRIKSDQMYHHYLGDPLEVLLLYTDGNAARITVGTDLRGGMRPQVTIPAGTFHTSRLAAGGRYALLGTSEWGGVEPGDVEIGNVEELMKRYPSVRDVIQSFADSA